MAKITLATLAIAGCSSGMTPPLPGDDPSAIVGHWDLASVNGATVFPATLASADTLVVQLSDATLQLNADGTYLTDEYVYEIRPSGTTGLPRPGSGHFALHGTSIDFTPANGVAPSQAVVNATGIRVVESLRTGRAADTLVLHRRVTP